MTVEQVQDQVEVDQVEVEVQDIEQQVAMVFQVNLEVDLVVAYLCSHQILPLPSEKTSPILPALSPSTSNTFHYSISDFGGIDFLLTAFDSLSTALRFSSHLSSITL